MGLRQSRNQVRISAKGFNATLEQTQTRDYRSQIPRKTRDMVWTKYHGTGDKGVCYCCGIFINRYNGSWHCAHVQARSKLGDFSIENLRTCCPRCNISMGNQNLYTYIKQEGLKGPGSGNVRTYMKNNPAQLFDKRTNHYHGLKTKKN